MRKLTFACVGFAAFALYAYSGVYVNGVKQNSSVNSSNSSGYQWLTNSQSVCVGTSNTNLLLSASNGVYCTMYLTNALVSNVVATIDFVSMGAPLTPLWLTALSTPTLIEALDTNTIVISGLVNDSGSAAWNPNGGGFWQSGLTWVITDTWDTNIYQVVDGHFPSGYALHTGDIFHDVYGYGFYLGYTSSTSPTGTLTAANTRYIYDNAGTPDGAYDWSSTKWVCAATGWYIQDDGGTLNVYDSGDNLINTLATYLNYYPDQTGGTSVYGNSNTTNAYALAWSTNCVAENGSVRVLVTGTNSYFITQHGTTNIVTGCITNMQTVVNP
jgi:hypothetical protein